jgi:hypothetical protein
MRASRGARLAIFAAIAAVACAACEGATDGEALHEGEHGVTLTSQPVGRHGSDARGRLTAHRHGDAGKVDTGRHLEQDERFPTAHVRGRCGHGREERDFVTVESALASRHQDSPETDQPPAT